MRIMLFLQLLPTVVRRSNGKNFMSCANQVGAVVQVIRNVGITNFNEDIVII